MHRLTTSTMFSVLFLTVLCLPASAAGVEPAPVPLSPNLTIVCLVLAFFAAMLAALVSAARCREDTFIPKLNASFFFWLDVLYLVLLFLGAVAYANNVYGICQAVANPFAGILPIAVPWFGALGAVIISLQGVYGCNTTWDAKYNYWHIARPLSGAVLGVMAFFLLFLINAASNATPKFLGANGAWELKEVIIYYVLAFLVGYREETFRELIKRVTDLIVKPSGAATATPVATAAETAQAKFMVAQTAAQKAQAELAVVQQAVNNKAAAAQAATVQANAAAALAQQAEADRIAADTAAQQAPADAKPEFERQLAAKTADAKAAVATAAAAKAQADKLAAEKVEAEKQLAAMKAPADAAQKELNAAKAAWDQAAFEQAKAKLSAAAEETKKSSEAAAE